MSRLASLLEHLVTTYTGIRCQYNVVSPAGGPLSTCVSVASSPSDAENSYPADSTPISTADWTAVANQLFSECQYAEGVQSLYSNFTTIIDTVFIENSSQVLNLANDVGLDSSTSVSAVPQALIEGIVYTVLSATGTAGGVLANLMETATNTVDAVQGNQPLTHPVAATVGTIYGDLATQFQSLEDQSANGENTISEDWGRLSVIGPRTAILGYNGLALTPLDMTNIETQAENGYALTFLSQLMPAKYVMKLEGDKS